MSITHISQGMPDFQSGNKGLDKKRVFRMRFSIGDILEGVVFGTEDVDALLYKVRVQGLELVAATPFQVRSGQRLMLKVEALVPEIILRCVRVLGSTQGVDMGGYFTARREYEKSGNSACLEQLHALRLDILQRLSVPVNWKYFSSRELEGGALAGLEAATWSEPNTELYRCLAAATLETGECAPQRLFMEGLAKPPNFSWNLNTDEGYPSLPESVRTDVEKILCECVAWCLPEPVLEQFCLSRKNVITGIGEIGPTLLARLGAVLK